MAKATIREFASKGLRAVRTATSRFRSFALLNWYRALYPGLTVGTSVVLGRGVHISVVRGAHMTIGDRVSIGSNVQLVSEGKLVIRSGGFIGSGSTIVAAQQIVIGRDALIAEQVTIRDQDHCTDGGDVPFNRQGLIMAPIDISENVWIGAKATILRGVTIGLGAVVAAHAVVNKSVMAGTIVGGIPAKLIKTRSRKLAP